MTVEFIKEFFQKDFAKRCLVLFIIIMTFYFMRSMINLILLTFLFTYLIYSLHSFLYSKIGKYIHVNEKAMTVLLYVVLIGLFTLFICQYVPKIINQTVELINEFSDIDINAPDNELNKYIMPIFQQIDLKSYLKDGTSFLVKFAANIGKWSFNIFVAIILSMFFMFEKKSIMEFMNKFESSKISWIYQYAKEFGKNFLNSFGKVIQTQIIIAMVNTVLSTIALSFMGFPQILGLAVMIFNLSLIPVAGTIASLIPLSIIALKIGGLIKVVYVLVMIALLHAIESYVLNPKFMSAKTKLPVFFTFIILIVSEHFMGIWGLLIGIPLFMFIMDLLNVNTGIDTSVAKDA